MEYICQIWIAFWGAAAIWFVSRIEHGQWGIFILSLFYTYSWVQGVYNYWIRPDKAVQQQEKIGTRK